MVESRRPIFLVGGNGSVRPWEPLESAAKGGIGTIENLLNQGSCRSESRLMQQYTRGRRAIDKVVSSGVGPCLTALAVHTGRGRLHGHGKEQGC